MSRHDAPHRLGAACGYRIQRRRASSALAVILCLGRWSRCRRRWLDALSVGDIVDFDCVRPDDRRILARHRLSRPRHALAHPRRRPLHRRHLARRRRPRLRLGRGARHDGGGDRRLARHRAQPLARRAELHSPASSSASSSSPASARRIPVLIVTLAVIYTPGAYRFARALAVNINTMDFVDRRPRPRRAHALPDRPRRSCRTSSDPCWPISACASCSSCCCSRASRSWVWASSRPTPTGARSCARTSAACPSARRRC